MNLHVATSVLALLAALGSGSPPSEPLAPSASRTPSEPGTPVHAASQEQADLSAEEAESLWPAPRPLTESIDRVVADVVESRSDCAAAQEGNVPCFPASVQVEGETLQDALDRFRRTGLGELPGGPSQRDEERLRRLQQSPNLVEGSFDPVCVGKTLLRLFKGKKNTFWIYRIKDHLGELVVMRDAPIQAESRLLGLPRAYELVGKFEGECAAVAAYRKALRALRKRQAEQGSRSDEWQ